jgi:hypothetical protein
VRLVVAFNLVMLCPAGGPTSLLRDRSELDGRGDRPREGVDRAKGASIPRDNVRGARQATGDQGFDRAAELTLVSGDMTRTG